MKKLLASIVILFFTGLVCASMLTVVYNPGVTARYLTGNASHYPYYMAF